MGEGKPRGGRASRQKGDRFERQLVGLLQDHAFGAERVPLSGSAGGSYMGDFTVPLLGRDLRVEAKACAAEFATLYAWLDSRDALVVMADRKPPLVVLPLALALEVMRAAETSKAASQCVSLSTGPASKGAPEHLGQCIL